MPSDGSSSRRTTPPKRVVELQRPTQSAPLPEGFAERDGGNSSKRRIVGTLQLLAGLILIVTNAKTSLFNDSDLVLLVGVLLTGGSTWWFGVFDRNAS